MSQRKGNSLALGAVYLAMAQELDLPIHGVNLPNHFILAYCDGGHLGEFSEDGGPGSVLFYINPFNKGGVIHPDEVNAFLGHLDLPVDQGHCGPCHPVDVVRRLIGNLAYAFERQEDLGRPSVCASCSSSWKGAQPRRAPSVRNKRRRSPKRGPLVRVVGLDLELLGEDDLPVGGVCICSCCEVFSLVAEGERVRAGDARPDGQHLAPTGSFRST